VPVYRPLPHDECSSCHADPHRGGLGATCTKCHETGGFEIVARGAFDHDRTRYPLRGRHAAVPCAKCHDFRTAAGKRPAFATCTACHADAHAGKATLAGRAPDCDACHSVAGFTPGVFTVEQHRATRYPLDGKHQTVPCGACHVKNPAGVSPAALGRAGVLMRPAFARCTSCHADDHGGQLAGRPGADDCAACHATAGWTPSRYTLEAHARLRLALTGRHAEVPCAACHGRDRKGLPPLPAGFTLGRAGVALRLREVTCPACHADPHEGRYGPSGARPLAAGCEACHDTRRFSPSTLDVAAHAKYDFPLEGAHRAVPCAGCHADLKAPGGTSSLVAAGGLVARRRFTVERRTCEACHTDPHGNQFAVAGAVPGCDRCHGADGFRPATRFDHERDAGFALKPAHERVPCGACHVPKPDAAGRSVTLYRPLSSKCESCHAAGVRRS